MSVNLRRFVNMNVSRTKRNIVNPVRDTVALYSSTAIANVSLTIDATTTQTIAVNSSIIIGSGEVVRNVDGSIKEYVASGIDAITGKNATIKIAYTVSSNVGAYANPALQSYLSHFFDNGGAKIHLYVGSASASAEHHCLMIGSNAVPVEEIAVATMDAAFEAGSGIDKLATDYNALLIDGLDQQVPTLGTSATKVFIAYADDAESESANENVGAKYAKVSESVNIPGIEMTILAYLSKINAYGENVVNDYNFTIENVDARAVQNDDVIVGACMSHFINVDTLLAKAVRNVGGDLMTGHDLVNYYVIIIMQQTCEEAVTNVLSDKLSGADGTATIYNALVTELNKYVRNGLLAAGNWEDVDWIVEYNGDSYVVANANERINLGYKVLVVPFAAMTQEDIADHKCPPIYVAMTNKYGIRHVFINGEVR